MVIKRLSVRYLTWLINYDSWLAIDDAHGIGVLGDKGAGAAAPHKSPDILGGDLW